MTPRTLSARARLAANEITSEMTTAIAKRANMSAGLGHARRAARGAESVEPDGKTTRRDGVTPYQRHPRRISLALPPPSSSTAHSKHREGSLSHRIDVLATVVAGDADAHRTPGGASSREEDLVTLPERQPETRGQLTPARRAALDHAWHSAGKRRLRVLRVEFARNASSPHRQHWLRGARAVSSAWRRWMRVARGLASVRSIAGGRGGR